MIHRKEIANIGAYIFQAPRNVTFGFQSKRNAFSIWYHGAEAHDTNYCVVETGQLIPYEGKWELVASCCIDGYSMFHLLRQV